MGAHWICCSTTHLRSLDAVAADSLMCGNVGSIGVLLVSQRFLAWPRVAGVIAAVLLLVGVCQSSPGRSALRIIGLIGNPNSFTAIAFANPQTLPVQLDSASTKLNLAFTISNDTINVARYQWSLKVAVNNNSKLVTNGNIQLAPNGAATVTRQIEITCKAGQAEVTVSLKDPDEHIDAWMTCR